MAVLALPAQPSSTADLASNQLPTGPNLASLDVGFESETIDYNAVIDYLDQLSQAPHVQRFDVHDGQDKKY